MARVKGNIVTLGISGKLYELLVFKHTDNGTIVTKAPEFKGEPASAPNQQAVQARFTLSAKYAKAACADPVKKAMYKEKADKGQTAFNIAFADYFNAPEIGDIDTSLYRGLVGDKVSALVTDDFKVANVKVSILKADGSLLEEGNAQLAENGSDWEYKTTVANPALTGSRVRFEARDIPDTVTAKEVVL